jgi:hypothetical protein
VAVAAVLLLTLQVPLARADVKHREAASPHGSRAPTSARSLLVLLVRHPEQRRR